MAIPLEGEQPYAYPPFAIARRVVQRLVQQQCAKAWILLRDEPYDGGRMALDAAVAAGVLTVVGARAVAPGELQAASGFLPQQITQHMVMYCVERTEGRRAVAWTGRKASYRAPNTRALRGTDEARARGLTRDEILAALASDGDVHPNPGPEVDVWDAAPDYATLQGERSEPRSVAWVVRTIVATAAAEAIQANAVFDAVADIVSPTLFEEWASMCAQSLARRTWRGYRNAAPRFAMYAKRMVVHPAAAWSDKLASALLAGYVKSRADEKLKAASIRNEVFAVRALLRMVGFSVEDAGRVLGEALRCAGCCRRAATSSKPPLGIEILCAMTDWLFGEPERAAQYQHVAVLCMLWCAYCFGLRGVEVRQLEWGHVEWDPANPAQAIVLRFDAESKNDRRFYAAEPHGRTGVGLSRRMFRVLRTWWAVQPAGFVRVFPALAQGARPTSGGCVLGGFTWADKALGDKVHNPWLTRLLKAAEVPDRGFTFHCVRVGLVVDLYTNGAGFKTIMAAGGWRSFAWATYCAVSDELVSEAVHAIELKRAPVPEAAELQLETGGSINVLKLAAVDGTLFLMYILHHTIRSMTIG